MGSAAETEYELLLARDLGYLDQDSYTDLDNKVQETRRLLSRLLSKLQADITRTDKQTPAGKRFKPTAKS